MKFPSSYWFYALAALITIIGLITGWYLFIFLVFPLGLFKWGKKDRNR